MFDGCDILLAGMALETRTVPRARVIHEEEIQIQGEWFSLELIESLLESDGYFSGVRWDGPRTWVPESIPEDTGGFRHFDDHPDYRPGYYIIEGQMGELLKRGLVRESNRGWYGTNTLKLLVEGQGGLP